MRSTPFTLGCLLSGWLLSPAFSRGVSPIPLVDNLRDLGRKVEKDSAWAEGFFDQGLCFYGGFNHGKALVFQRRPDGPAVVRPRFRAAWDKSDLKLTTPCLCQPRV